MLQTVPIADKLPMSNKCRAARSVCVKWCRRLVAPVNGRLALDMSGVDALAD